MYVATRIDPLFLIIPMLEKSRNRSDDRAGFFCSLNQTLLSCGFEGGSKLLGVSRLTETLQQICDVNESSDSILYRLSDEKILNWLKLKYDRLLDCISNTLPEVKIATTSTAANFTMDPTNQVATDPVLDQASCQLHAISVLGEYLSEPLVTKLAEHLGVKLTAPAAAAEVVLGGGHITSVKRTREDETTVEPKAKRKAPTPASKLAKIDTRGMKSVASFFTKKP
eukprot:GILJ01004150.1.p1 GENE.GILJ01004150.1~~GILJ01004150.1.p1  ORF type:complete len:225 (-),score=26.52 GILJ01004150.1:896-1570(-)